MCIFHLQRSRLMITSDEALAVALLKRTEEFKDATLVRTRDPKKLEECDIVIDVGGVYDPSRHRYDHHQVISRIKKLIQ